MRNKLGKVTSASRVSVNVHSDSNTTTTRATFQTKHEHGEGHEELVWTGALDGDLVLIGYHIFSPQLEIK